MTSIAIRKSGGANIVSLPVSVVKSLGLEVGSRLELSIEGNRIVLTPVRGEVDLESLLAGSPRQCFAIMEEDKAWMEDKPKGREI